MALRPALAAPARLQFCTIESTPVILRLPAATVSMSVVVEIILSCARIAAG